MTVTVVESSDVGGTADVVEKSLDATGRTAFEKSSAAARFYRLVAEVEGD
ncbi:MAG: hypothetical protein IJ829_04965 [Kiritimatiellae bacterium]|nr:hypothetical protein [Kiritimatiellia bacterium]